MRRLLALPRALWGMSSLLWAPRMGDLLIALAVLGSLVLCGCTPDQREWAGIAVLTLVTTAIIATPIGLWWLHNEVIRLRGDIRVIEAGQAAVERRDAAQKALIDKLERQTRGGWTWRMWRRLRGLPVVVLLALLGCEAQTVAPDEDMAGGEVVTPSDLGTVKLYKPCTPATRLDTIDHCGYCGHSCRGAEWPGFPLACCPPRPGSSLTYCTILNTLSDCAGCGDMCPPGWQCQARKCVP